MHSSTRTHTHTHTHTHLHICVHRWHLRRDAGALFLGKSELQRTHERLAVGLIQLCPARRERGVEQLASERVVHLRECQSAYVSIRQHTSAYARVERGDRPGLVRHRSGGRARGSHGAAPLKTAAATRSSPRASPGGLPAYVSIRQRPYLHTSAHMRIRQHT